MQKTKLWPEIKNLFIIDASCKYLLLWWPENFVKIAVNHYFTRYMQKTKLCFETENHLGIDTSHKIPPPLVTRKYRQNRRKTIVSRDICKKWNYAPKSKTIWELIHLIKYLPLWWHENFVKITVKPLFHEVCAEIEIKARNKKPFGNWYFS